MILIIVRRGGGRISLVIQISQVTPIQRCNPSKARGKHDILLYTSFQVLIVILTMSPNYRFI